MSPSTEWHHPPCCLLRMDHLEIRQSNTLCNRDRLIQEMFDHNGAYWLEAHNQRMLFVILIMDQAWDTKVYDGYLHIWFDGYLQDLLIDLLRIIGIPDGEPMWQHLPEELENDR
jgi:hypothetical protein